MQAHRDRQQSEHAETHKRNQRGHGVTELELVLRQTDEWSHRIAETHRQKGQEYRECVASCCPFDPETLK
jgi:hypothetical protein